MASDKTIAGIARSGSPGSYTYSMISPSGTMSPGDSTAGNRPVSYITWFNAARFANWMHNGQGNGDTETAAYNLNGVTGGPTVPTNPKALFRIQT